jgi:YhcN/YlaJ family sporulation lipoprotein
VKDLLKYFILTLIPFMLVGCGMQNEANEQQNNQQSLVQVKDTSIENVDRKTGQEISRHLVELATSLPNVNDATAVVIGKYAIVGIDIDKDLDRTEVGSIKYSVAESLKNDPHGAQAIVVADPDINARLKEVSGDIQDGKPIQGIINELAEISGRLIPEIPGDITEPTPKGTTENPKEMLNKKEQQNLEEKQEQQSNHHK